jgi:hypothetical protein
MARNGIHDPTIQPLRPPPRPSRSVRAGTRLGMPAAFTPIRERAVPADGRLPDDVLEAGEPCVMRGLVAAWPAVSAGRAGGAAFVAYLARFDNQTPVDAILTPPEVSGRVFYRDDMNGFNFVRNRLPVTQVAEQVMRYARFEHPPAVAVQSALIGECLPGFAAENPLGLLAPEVLPRIWFGNAITTPTHLDEWNNIGCVVCGARRFTLFPPHEIDNLYIGPLDFAPTGAPMSLVPLHAPDFARFPKFRQALQAARQAVLGPGDAIYIPPLWFHHVESLEPFNALVNYWWHAAGGTVGAAPSGFDALMHGMLNLRSLPAPVRAAWRALFEHYVFAGEGAASEHIPAHRRGVLGALDAADAERLRALLAERLKT